MLTEFKLKLVEEIAEAIYSNEDLLTELDQAIGDADHGVNMSRGMRGAYLQREKLAELSFTKALNKLGTTLVMHIGGAAGPLYGSLFMAMGKAGRPPLDLPMVAEMFQEGVRAVMKRGKSEPGEKTMLDVLAPVSEALSTGVKDGLPLSEVLARVRNAADKGLESTRDMVATKGRASFLGERSRGHLDPGAQSCRIIIDTACSCAEKCLLGGQRQANVAGYVGIVIVSHSKHVARGTADMVRQMVGEEVPLAWAGGNLERGLGTDLLSIKDALEKAWSPAGVAVLVDLGGAETNTEMAIEMLPREWQERIVICNAPIVEGAVMAATESSGGGTLADVCATAEELSPQ